MHELVLARSFGLSVWRKFPEKKDLLRGVQGVYLKDRKRVNFQRPSLKGFEERLAETESCVLRGIADIALFISFSAKR
jgi:hypothetical protein